MCCELNDTLKSGCNKGIVDGDGVNVKNYRKNFATNGKIIFESYMVILRITEETAEGNSRRTMKSFHYTQCKSL